MDDSARVLNFGPFEAVTELLELIIAMAFKVYSLPGQDSSSSAFAGFSFMFSW